MKRQTKNNTPLHWKPAALAVALAFAPAYAQAQVTAAGGGPAVGAALNGVPIVNIVAPNGAGLSHNKYLQFNVDNRGLILNNGTQGGVSQLGGAVLANPNLGGGGARIILNEVVAPNRSMLNGFTEVYGLPADVVLANPAGITCNGCGFINTPRATLTTGTPNIDAAGNLTGFAVRGGDISITGAGLDATGQTYFDILARAVSVTGQINARDLNIVGGSHDYDYAGRTATPVAGGPGAPTIAIDSSALGGMYVDRIRLIATENGVGVRLLGDVGASVADVMLTASGQIQLLGKMTAKTDIAVSGNGISSGSGTLVAAAGNLTLGGGAGGLALNGGTLGADGNATFSGASLTDTGSASDLRFADGLLTLNIGGAASVDGPNWNGGGGLTVNAGSLSVGAGGAGFFAASNGSRSGAVSIHTAGNLALGGGAVSGTSVTLTSDSGTLSLGSTGAVDSSGAITLTAATLTNAGKVDGDGLVDLNATGIFTNSGTVKAAGTLDVAAATLDNQSGGTLLGDLLTINATSATNAGKLQGTHGATISTGTFTNQATGLAVLSATVGSNGTLTANSVTNLGSARSGGVATAGITSSGGMTLNVRDTLSNAGNLVASQDLIVQASSGSTLAVTNSSLIQAGNTLTLQGNGGGSNMSLTNNGGATILADQLLVRSSSMANSGAVQGVSGSTLSASGTFVNNAAGVLTLAHLGSLTAASISNSGRIQSFGSMTLSATPLVSGASALYNSASGTIVANDDLTLQLGAPVAPVFFAFPLFNQGSIQAGGVLAVNAAGGVILNDNGALMRAGTVNIASPAAILNNFSMIFSAGAMTANVSAISNHSNGALFSQGNMALTAGGDITNDPAGVILAGGTMSLTSTSGDILNGMAYGSSGDQIGTIQSNGNLTISAVGGTLTNHGYIDSNGGNVTITASSVVNESFVPSGIIPITQRQVLDNTVAVFAKPFICSSFVVFPKGGCSAGFDYQDGLGWWPQDVPHDDAHIMYWLFDPTTGVPVMYNPATGGSMPGGPYLYRDWSGKAFSGFMYDRTPVQAHIVANNGSVTINSNVQNIGAEIRAQNNLTINGHVDQTPIALGGMTVWDVQGQDRWFCPPSVCGGAFTMDSHIDDLNFGAFYLSNMVFDAAYRTQGVNDPLNGQYTIGASVTGSMVTLSAILQSSGGQRTENTAEASASNPGAMTITGGVTNHLPAGMIPGLSQLGVSQIAPITPVVASTGTTGGASGVQPASALIAAGVNLSLPTNPNGLFIVNPNPNAKYLVELNPLYTSLENILFGSDYLVGKLGINPDTVIQRLGDAAYEAQLITQQVARQTGRSLIAGAEDVNAQLERLYNNAAWESKDLGLSFGVALTANQLNSLKQDMVWMVETVVQGHRVLAPVVYLSNATRASVVGGTQIVASNLAVSGGSFINNGGTVDVTRSLSIHTTGDIVNTAGTISGGDVSLVSDTGNITNNSRVARLGDTQNYRDVIDRGAIVSTGTLNIAATTGNVTNTGGQIKSGGDATVSAGRNITFEAVVLESQSVTHKESTAGMFGTQKKSETVTTTTQQAVGGDLSSGGNLTLNAGRDVTLVGSQVGAKRDLNVDAQNVNVLNTTTTNTKVTEKSESGLGVSISSGGTIGMGYGSSSSTTTQTDVNVVASGLSGGGNTRITGRDSVTVRGSDVKSGGDLTVNTNRLDTQAAQQTTTVDRTGTSSYGGFYAGGNANTASAGWEGHRTDDQSNSVTSTARTSTLGSGGNMTLGNAAGTGTINHQGTEIDAGGNFTQRGATINFTAAQNTTTSSSSSTTTGGKTGINVNVNAQQTYDQAKGGGVPDASAPSVTGSIGAQRDESSASSSSSTAVAGHIRAGGNVTTISSGTTTLEGTNIQSGGNTTIGAGTLNYNAATSTRQSSNNSMTAGGSAYVGEDATGSVVGGASGNYGTSNSSGSGTSQRAGSIVSGGNTTITTTGDATFQGTNMNTRGNTTISAGGKVDYQAAVDTSSSSNASQNMSGGFDASKTGKGSEGSKSGQVSGSYDNSSGSDNVRIERGGTIVSGGNVNISAGRTSDLSMTGTDIAAGGNVGLSAGRNVDLRAAESSAQSSSSSMSAGGSAGRESPNKGSKDKGGTSGSGNYASGDSGSSIVSQRGALITGQNVTIGAGNDVSMQGTVVGAQNTASLTAGGKLDMQSAQTRSSSSSSNLGISAGGSKGDSSGGHAGADVGNASSDGVVNRNAIVSGGTVNVTTGGNATLRGANIAGGNVTTNVGGNLTIESRADVSNSSNRQGGGYAGGSNSLLTSDFDTNSIVSQRGELAKTGVAANYSSSNSSSTQVTMQSGITAQRSNTVNVTGSTDLTGARIGADAGGAVTLATTALTQRGVEQSSQSSGSGFSVALKPGEAKAPGSSTTSQPSTSSTLESSVGVAPALAPGQTPVTPTIQLAQLGTVLNAPMVQTALKLNKGMKTAVEQYGSADNVPADTVRRILGDAGVAIPEGTTDRSLRVLFNNSLDSAYAAAMGQLSATNIPPSQAGSILKAIIP